MIQFNRKGMVLIAAAGLGATGMAVVMRDTLIINGNSTQADVRMINGSAYVRLSDVAKALDLTLVKRGDGKYELVKSGGANQIAGLKGKVGDTLFDGKWRFTLVNVDMPESYQMKTDAEGYDPSGTMVMDSRSRLIKPAKGYKLVVLTVRVANGVKERRTLWTAISDEKIRTSIADTEGSSHPPVAYDFKGGPVQTEWLLPGAQLTFPVVFTLPETATPQDLVFTLKNNQGDEKGIDVRVSLAK